MPPSAKKPYTLEEFRDLGPDDAFRHELNAGRVVRDPRPGRRHGTTVARICRILVDYSDRHGGLVTTATGFVLHEDPLVLRGPDVAFLRKEPAPYGDADGFIRGAPDLAVEVLSPHDRVGELTEKVDQYLAAGSAEVWVVFPTTRRVRVERPGADPQVFRPGDSLDSRVLPGFSMPIDELFRS